MLIPSPGNVPEFDEANAQHDEIDTQMKHSLKAARKLCGTAKWYHPKSGNDKYQIEAPAKVKMPSDWEVKTQTKAVKRWWSPEIADLQQSLASQSHVLSSLTFLKMTPTICDIWI